MSNEKKCIHFDMLCTDPKCTKRACYAPLDTHLVLGIKKNAEALEEFKLQTNRRLDLQEKLINKVDEDLEKKIAYTMKTLNAFCEIVRGYKNDVDKLFDQLAANEKQAMIKEELELRKIEPESLSKTVAYTEDIWSVEDAWGSRFVDYIKVNVQIPNISNFIEKHGAENIVCTITLSVMERK